MSGFQGSACRVLGFREAYVDQDSSFSLVFCILCPTLRPEARFRMAYFYVPQLNTQRVLSTDVVESRVIRNYYDDLG